MTADATHAVRLEPARLADCSFSAQAVALRAMTPGHPAVGYGWILVADPGVAPQRGDLVLVAPPSLPPVVGAVQRVDHKVLAIGSAATGSEQCFSLGSVAVATIVALFSPGHWSAADEPAAVRT